MAFDGQVWKVSIGITSCVAVSRWTNAMRLGEYGRARDEIVRLLLHPGPISRSMRADSIVFLHVPLLIGENSPESAIALREWTSCGIYSESKMAKSIAGFILSHCYQLHHPITEEIRMLARALAVACKRTKKWIRWCDEIQTWDEFRVLVVECCSYYGFRAVMAEVPYIVHVGDAIPSPDGREPVS